MNGLKLLVLACAASLALGCGGVPADVPVDGEEVGVSSQELTVCTATCAQGSVSCPSTTTNCSAANNVGVTCDGAFYACPTPPAPTCDAEPCANFQDRTCRSQGVGLTCCGPGGYEWRCECTEVRKWSCG